MIVQFGGQTPLKLAQALEDAGVPILGTSPDAIDLAEDRDRFSKLIRQDQDLRQPENGIATSGAEAKRMVAKKIGFPVVIRPSYVLGGRAMEIVKDDAQLQRYITDRPSWCRVTRLCSSTPICRTPSRWMWIVSATAGTFSCRRRHGAHRGGRHSFRRLGLLAAALFA